MPQICFPWCDESIMSTIRNNHWCIHDIVCRLCTTVVSIVPSSLVRFSTPIFVLLILCSFCPSQVLQSLTRLCTFFCYSHKSKYKSSFIFQMVTYKCNIYVSSGYLHSFCHVLIEELDRLPGDARTAVGFLCYDKSLYYFNLSNGLSRPQMMCVSELEGESCEESA